MHLILLAFAVALLGLTVAYLDGFAAGAFLFAVAVVLRQFGLVFARLTHSAGDGPGPWPGRTMALFDLLLIAIMVNGLADLGLGFGALFLPLALAGVTRLLEAFPAAEWTQIFTDRASLAVLLGILSVLFGAEAAMEIQILLILAAGLVAMRAGTKLTPA